jgi:hypothetical protein
VCFLKIAAGKSVEVFTGVSSLVHATQHCLRCERIIRGYQVFLLTYFVVFINLPFTQLTTQM